MNEMEEDNLHTVVMGNIDPVKLEVTMDEENSEPRGIKNLGSIVDNNNPWAVGDASAFLKYCCPECDYQILNLQMFSEHALENHSKSVALFGPVHTGNVHSFGKISTPDIEEEKMELKRETLDNDDEVVDNDNENYNHMEDTYEDGNELDTIENQPETKVEPMEPLDTPNQCSYCDFSSSSVINIIKHHSELHEDESPPFFKCYYCEFYHKKKRAVQEHSRTIHGKHFIPYKCKTCGKKIGKIQTFRDHLKAATCKKPKKGIGNET